MKKSERAEIFDDKLLSRLENGELCRLCERVVIGGSSMSRTYLCEGSRCDDILYRIHENDPSIRLHLRKEKVKKLREKCSRLETR